MRARGCFSVFFEDFERALRDRGCFSVFFEVDLDETDLRAKGFFFCEVDLEGDLRARGCEKVDLLHFAIDDDVVVALRLAGNLIGVVLVLIGAVCFFLSGVVAPPGGPKRNGGGACNPIARAPPSVVELERESKPI